MEEEKPFERDVCLLQLNLRDSVPAQRNEEEVQENKSSRHNSVTAAVSNGQTTSQALTVENKRHF